MYDFLSGDFTSRSDVICPYAQKSLKQDLSKFILHMKGGSAPHSSHMCGFIDTVEIFLDPKGTDPLRYL